MKLIVYSVWHNYIFILLFIFWLLVSASIGHHQANSYKIFKKTLKNDGLYYTHQHF